MNGKLARVISPGERFRHFNPHGFAENTFPDLSIPTGSTVAEGWGYLVGILANQGTVTVVHTFLGSVHCLLISLGVSWNLGDMDDAACPRWALVPVRILVHRCQDFVYVPVSLVDSSEPLYASW